MAGWSYNPQSYQDELKKSKASIPQAAQPKPPGAIPGMGYGQVMAASQAKTPTPAIPQAASNPVSTGNPAISQGMAAVYAAPKPQGAIPQAAPTPGSHESHQAYINKTVPGGLAAYQATQQGRYDKAYASGNQEEINKLNADVQRAGYSLMIPQAAQPKPVATPETITSGPTPPVIPQMSGDAVTNVRSSSELQAQSGDSLAIERAALKNAIDTQMASLKNNSQYANQLTNDSRVLQDFSRTQTANPFANMGRKSFEEGLIGRQRSIDDSSRNSELTNQMNSLTTEIANFDKLQPERQRQIYNELLQLERNFGVQQGQLTGNYGGQRTLAGQAQDWSQNVDEANLTGTYGGQKTAAQQAQEWNQRFQYGNATGTFGNGQKTLDMKQFDENKRRYGEEFAYQQERNKIADENDKRDFDERVRQSGIDNAVQWYNSKTSRNSSNNASSNANHNKLMDIWKATGKAPAGIDGVTQGTAWYDEVGARQGDSGTQLSDKDSTDNYNTVYDDLQSPGVTKDKARQLLQANKSYLSDSDYNKLNSWINDNY